MAREAEENEKPFTQREGIGNAIGRCSQIKKPGISRNYYSMKESKKILEIRFDFIECGFNNTPYLVRCKVSCHEFV
jgi:hypothetical protein